MAASEPDAHPAAPPPLIERHGFPVIRTESEAAPAARHSKPGELPQPRPSVREPLTLARTAGRSLAAWAKARRWGIDAAEIEPPQDTVESVLKGSPPWLVSLVVHMIVLILLGLLVLKVNQSQELELNARYAEQLGEQLEEMTVGLEPEMPMDDEAISPSDFEPVVDPLASPPEIETTPDGLLSTTPLDAPPLAMALSGREKGMKEALRAAYGGTHLTKEAVEMALDWLARNQRKDGTWSLKGPYKNGSTFGENRQAATAMALLAFQGDGHTHQEEGPYQKTVKRGWDALLRTQNSDGDFFVAGAPIHHRMYTHAQCAIALCELYGMTEDSQLREPAQRAIDYLVRTQAPEGGWRYFPGNDSDTSVTGWVVMALQSARMAKLEVPNETLERVGRFLDSVAIADGSRYFYKPNNRETYAMTAEGLLCRQYLGWKRDDPRLIEGALFLGQHPIDWKKRNVYYWYYATQMMHHMEGKHWQRWNAVMRQTLPEHQVKSGRERGSWDPGGDEWQSAGRLYVTCLSTYMLEVYYRHLPLYSSVAPAGN